MKDNVQRIRVIYSEDIVRLIYILRFRNTTSKIGSSSPCDEGKSLGEAFLRVRGRVKDGSARSSELSFEDLPRNTLKM